MTHSYVWHDSFLRGTWFIHTCDMTCPYVWHDSFICVPWLVHTCDMTHAHVWHDSFIRVTWLMHMWDMTHSRVWHIASHHIVRIELRSVVFFESMWYTRITWDDTDLIETCRLSWVYHIASHHNVQIEYIRFNRLVYWYVQHEWVMSHIRMSHVTHMNESCPTYEWVMSHIWIYQIQSTHLLICATSLIPKYGSFWN